MKKAKLFISLIFLFELLNAQLSSNHISMKEKVFGLSSFWKEVTYNYIGYDTIFSKRFDSLYFISIEEMLKSRTDFDYYHIMKRLASFIKDEHTGVYFENEDAALDYIELATYNIGKKAYVSIVPKKISQSIPLGSEVTSINNLPIETYLRKYKFPYIFASTEQVRYDLAINSLFFDTADTKVFVKFLRPDKSIFDTVFVRNGKRNPMKREDALFMPYYFNNDDFGCRLINDNSCYLRIPSFNDEMLFDRFKEKVNLIYESKYLILDIRDNSGGNGSVVDSILSYFVESGQLKSLTWATRVHNAAYKAWGNFVPEYNSFYKMDFIQKFEDATLAVPKRKVNFKIFVLINSRTCSSAENMVLQMKVNNIDFEVIGQVSSGSTGSPLVFDIPGGYARVCAKMNYDETGKPFRNRGIVPEIYIEETMDDYLNQKDPVLERAIELCK